MHRIYSDEDFPHATTIALRLLGHDVLRVQEDGMAGSIDSVVLQRAITLGRAVTTINGWDFIRLHRQNAVHHGIIRCTYDEDHLALAQRIHAKIVGESSLVGRLVLVNKS
jgi:hypothetical protein